ncbi:MAG: hypothetical protein LKH33_10355 [Acetobacter sp.]|jgi:hypothetical protein|nr:hypothetical protein [Acetobacter sp.]MCH4060541.1 hypothetical protein [Acetobacter sp.]MCH4087481.1 hypothetical protein [Acetobacter sp.]MCI1294682.1 hypothetical protein [Acetobacter sp.]MCI1321169.1 hypothetical protein [Acetobacter sp.]
MRVKQGAGRLVRNQSGQPVGNKPFEVNERDFFWAALIRSGDIVPDEETKALAKPAGSDAK